jgi:molybdopterin biosynthesis enzyme MoaB
LEAYVAIIIVSDTRSSGEAEDASGPAAVEALTALGLRASEPMIVPDEVEAIQQLTALS